MAAKKRNNEETEAKLLRRYLDTSVTGLTRLSRDLRYLEGNTAYANLAGLPRDQIVGRPMVDVLGVAGLKKIRPYFERARNGERVEYEAEVPFAVSGPRWLHVVYTPEARACRSSWRNAKSIACRSQQLRFRFGCGMLEMTIDSWDTGIGRVLSTPSSVDEMQ